jgi:FkbM family methyltransferase
MDARSQEIMHWITTDGGERKVHQLLGELFRAGCSATPQMFVDVGSNAGFYSLLAAAYGCQVLLFDPQPSCIKLVQSNLCLNQGLQAIKDGLVTMINQPVSDVTVATNLTLPSSCQGTFALRPAGARKLQHLTQPVSLDAVLFESGVQLYVVKIDTEGFELSVLRSMKKLLAARRVQHLVVEVTPLFWKRDGIDRVEVYHEFEPFLAMGCTIQRVLDVDFDASAPQHVLGTTAELRAYLVERDFVQVSLCNVRGCYRAVDGTACFTLPFLQCQQPPRQQQNRFR